MKASKAMVLTMAAGSLLAVRDVHASYLGLSVTVTPQTVAGTLRNVYRVYANFSDPNDYLTVVFGSPTLGNMVIQSRNLTDTGPGSNFVNIVGGGATAPSLSAIAANPDVAFDTFVTIGVPVSDLGSGPAPSQDLTSLSPGFGAGIGNVSTYDNGNGGWFTPGPVDQGRAGYLGDGDSLLRVLMMQLTVSSTSCVRGTVNLSGVNNTPLGGGQSFTIGGQTFVCIPTPGTLALLAFAGFAGRGRRRK